jgi:hypothetical protein
LNKRKIAHVVGVSFGVAQERSILEIGLIGIAMKRYKQ